MKPRTSALVLVGTCLLANCSLTSSDKLKSQAYQQGFRAGVQNEMKRQYFADQNAVLPPVDGSLAELKPIVVPEYVAPDGVIIAEHEVVTNLEPTSP